MHQPAGAAFGKVRSYVWPIYRHELRKVLPMFIMLFCVCFNYTILKNLKDTLVVTAKYSGAAVIPFIKVWVVLPAAILATMLFSYLTNRFSRRKVFYIVLCSFLSYFFVFTFFIYPMGQALSADRLAEFLQASLPLGFKGLISMVRNWPLTMFYVIAELWSTMVLSVLFWGFANEITRISEATRFYSALNISSNVASIVAGQVAAYLSTAYFSSMTFLGNTAWDQAMTNLTISMLLSGCGILASFHWMTKNILNNPKYMPEEARQTKKEKKLTFKQSIAFVAGSKYLLCIAALVVSYNLVIHMVEIIWKDRLHQLYPNPSEYNSYMNNLTSIMGIISTTAALVMVGIIRKLGWTKTALITPLVLLITTIAFFACLMADSTLSPYLSVLFGMTPLALAVFLGSVQNCFTKAAKFSLFDVTKEMTFIPLAPEHKLKGKAAIDGIGSRLGKSGGSLIHQGLIMIFYSLSCSTPYVAAILVFVLVVWISAVRYLGKQFKEKTGNALEEPEQPAKSTPSVPDSTMVLQPQT